MIGPFDIIFVLLPDARLRHGDYNEESRPAIVQRTKLRNQRMRIVTELQGDVTSFTHFVRGVQLICNILTEAHSRVD
jgi:hypothetical protein